MVEYFVTKGKLVVRNGEPLVVAGGEAKVLSQPEFILWTSLHWNILNKDSLKEEFNRRMRKYGLYGDVSFEQTLWKEILYLIVVIILNTQEVGMCALAMARLMNL